MRWACCWRFGRSPRCAVPIARRVRPLGTPTGPVKILEFYASVGSLTIGQKALLCYGVENAKSVRSRRSCRRYPSRSVTASKSIPERTTHYTILAEGYDGNVATQSFTLPVQPPIGPSRPVNYADVDPISDPPEPAPSLSFRTVNNRPLAPLPYD